MKVHNVRTRGVFGLAAALLSAALLTACGGGDTDAGSAPAAGDSGQVLGPDKAATGDPVKIGWVSTGQTQATDTTDEIKAAQAVTAYANAHLGGIGGRPIDLVVCEEKGTPAGAQDCGNKFVSEGVSAIAAGTAGQIDPWLQIVAPAGIPVGLNLASTQTVLSTPGVFVWSNPVSAYGTPAAFAREKKLTSAAIVVIDVPGASGPAKRLGPAFFKNAGSSAAVVPIASGTPDMTPQIQAAQNQNPQMYFVLGDPTFCSSAMKAIKTLGISAPIVALDRCIGDDKGASIPGGFDGVEIATQAVTNPGDPEFELYKAVLGRYGDGLEASSQTISGYQGMLSMVRAVNASNTTDLSAAGIKAALSGMPATPYPLGGGGTFQCNGKALTAISPNICSTIGVISDASAEGDLSNFRVLNSDGIYSLGS
jgi:branched-chain amino acid transport system substrate-binding protein